LADLISRTIEDSGRIRYGVGSLLGDRPSRPGVRIAEKGRTLYKGRGRSEGTVKPPRATPFQRNASDGKTSGSSSSRAPLLRKWADRAKQQTIRAEVKHRLHEEAHSLVGVRDDANTARQKHSANSCKRRPAGGGSLHTGGGKRREFVPWCD
jgi:hypothetical protein